jgi:hypothetical protein
MCSATIRSGNIWELSEKLQPNMYLTVRYDLAKTPRDKHTPAFGSFVLV